MQRMLTVTVGKGALGVIHTVLTQVDDKGVRHKSELTLEDGTVLELNIALDADKAAS